MRTGTEFIRLPIILFTMLLLASCGNDGPTPEDTATDVARKFAIHFLNEEYEEVGEYCLGPNYSYDIMRSSYEYYLPEIEEHFDDVDDYLDAIDFDSPEIRKDNSDRQVIVDIRKDHGVEVVEGAEEVWITFNKRLDGLPLEPSVLVRTIKHEGVWKALSHCADKKALSTAVKKILGIDE